MKNGGRILWSVTAICETFKISCLMGRQVMNGDSANHFEGPKIPCGSMMEYHPFSAKDLSRLHQFGLKVLPRKFLGCVSYAGRIWKGDILVADIEERERMDATEIHAKGLNAKEQLKPKMVDFSDRRWNSQTVWRRSGSENIQLDTRQP